MNELLKNKYFRLFLLLVIFGIIINIGYKKYKIEGDSMNNTYKEGETLYVDKTTYKITTPDRGDVVVFYDLSDDETLVKRIIGLPGEKIEIKDGDIYIDGSLYQDEYSYRKIRVMLVGAAGIPLRNWKTNEIIYENENIKFEKLKEDEYWVIGDNRHDSWYGVIYKNEIKGKTND